MKSETEIYSVPSQHDCPDVTGMVLISWPAILCGTATEDQTRTFPKTRFLDSPHMTVLLRESAVDWTISPASRVSHGRQGRPADTKRKENRSSEATDSLSKEGEDMKSSEAEKE